VSVVWRIARAPYAALDGEGARRTGGRWNSKGVPLVYASRTLSLAALELLVHVDPATAPRDLVALAIVLPDDAPGTSLSDQALPDGWRAVEPPEACRQFGDQFVQQNDALVLSVPSVIIPREQNVVINPRHVDMSRVRIESSEPFTFDPRLLHGVA